MTLKVAALALACAALAPVCLANPAGNGVAQALIGQVWQTGEPYTERMNEIAHGCTDDGGATVSKDGVDQDYSLHLYLCQGRKLLMLARNTRGDDGIRRNTVVDARLLPKQKKGEYFWMAGDCELDGRIDTSFVAIANLGRREKVDGRNGVKGAWGVDVEQGKLVALPLRRIVCFRPTPP